MSLFGSLFLSSAVWKVLLKSIQPILPGSGPGPCPRDNQCEYTTIVIQYSKIQPSMAITALNEFNVEMLAASNQIFYKCVNMVGIKWQETNMGQINARALAQRHQCLNDFSVHLNFFGSFFCWLCTELGNNHTKRLRFTLGFVHTHHLHLRLPS